MDVIKNLIERAQQNKQRIVLPEGTEERTLKAADKALADGIAELVILGNKEEILALAQKNGLTNIEKATIIDPENNPDAEKYATLLFELRKSKGMTMEDAQKLVCNPLCGLKYRGRHHQDIRCPTVGRGFLPASDRRTGRS